MTYFNSEQLAQMLRGINPKRVGSDGKGYAHVEAYEIRAHLNRIMGFARWSADVIDQALVFEGSVVTRRKNKKGEEYGDPYEAWTVCYRSLLRLTVCAPDGTVLATYTEGATGEAQNQPSRGDAHDLALKTSESQALKRAAFNLGDQFGLSLFGKGSTAALVRKTLVMPDAEPSEDAVDSHITQQIPREDETPEPEDDPRSTSQAPAAPVPAAAGPAAGGDIPPSPPAAPDNAEAERRQAEAQRIRDLAIGDIPAQYKSTPGKWVMHLTGEAMKAKVLQEKVESLISPTQVTLKVVLEQALRAATDAQRQAS